MQKFSSSRLLKACYSQSTIREGCLNWLFKPHGGAICVKGSSNHQQLINSSPSNLLGNSTRRNVHSSSSKNGNNDDDDDFIKQIKKLGLGQGSDDVKKHLEDIVNVMLKPGGSPIKKSNTSSSSDSNSEGETPKAKNTFLEDEERLNDNFNRIVFEAYRLHRKSFEEQLTPHEIVNNLEKHIVGQKDAKRAVAVALRNRFRRKVLLEWFKEKGEKTKLDPNEIIPKNILMIGPTG